MKQSEEARVEETHTTASAEDQPVTGNAARVRRFRKSHRRIDFVPSADVALIVDQQLAAGLDNCLSGVIDRLIRLGHEAAVRGRSEAVS